MNNNAHSQVVALPEMLLDRIDWMSSRLKNHIPLRALPSPKTLRHQRQIAGVINAWLRQGRQVEFSGPLSVARDVSLALIAESAGLHLSALIQPEIMTEVEWATLSTGINKLQRAALVFRTCPGSPSVSAQAPTFFTNRTERSGVEISLKQGN